MNCSLQHTGRTIPSNIETSCITSFREPSHPCRQFELPEILLATDNFNESLVIWGVGVGIVYKGNIINGSTISVVSIKRLGPMHAAEFWTEVETLSKLRHYHLLSLLGYCNNEKETILVYEYMPNGSLANHLYRIGTSLSWLRQLKICIGAARGLDYLHTRMGIDFVVHRNVNSTTILLHQSWAAKISGIGLAKIGAGDQSSTYINTVVKGTFGYVDHYYYMTGMLKRKSDVYAFGVVLLEVLCWKPAIDTSIDKDPLSLVRWFQDSIKEGNLKHIIDSDIRDQISPRCLKEFVRIVERCLHNDPKTRPMMAEIVVSLVYVLNLQEKMDSSLQPTRRTIFDRMFNNKRAGHL